MAHGEELIEGPTIGNLMNFRELLGQFLGPSGQAQVLARFCRKSATCLFLKENLHLATCGALLGRFVGSFVMHSA